MNPVESAVVAPPAGDLSGLHADWILTMDGNSAETDGGLVRDAVVVLDGTQIVDVVAAAAVHARHPSAVVERLAGHVLMPGLINAHSHLAMTMFRGVADDRDLEEFLGTVVPLEAALLDPERVLTATRAGMYESLMAGVTTVLDMYFFCDAAAAGAASVGGRLLTGPVILDGSGPDDDLIRAAVGSAGNSGRSEWAAEWCRSHPRDLGRRAVLGPHSVYTVSPAQLSEVSHIAGETGALVHVHAAETLAEIGRVQAMHRRRPLELLDDVGLLGPNVVIAHCVHPSDTEMDRLAETGTAVAHCPASNLKLCSGVAPVRSMRERGVTVALGTDGPASSNDLDVLGVARLAAMLHKTAAPEAADPRSMPAAEALHMATRGGASALGMDGTIGVIRRGAIADLVAIDLSTVHAQPVYDPCSALVYAAGRADVNHVWVNGRRVVRDGVHTGIGAEEVVADLVSLSDAVRGLL